MSRTIIIRLALYLFLVCLIISSLLPLTRTRSDSSVQATGSTPPVEPAAAAMPALQGEEAIEHLKEQGTYGSLEEAMAAVKYDARWQPKPQLAGVGAAQELKNRANNLLAYVTAEGIDVISLGEEKKSWRLGLKLKGIGYGASLFAVSPGAVSAKANRVEIKRNNGLTEWFVNSHRGIEQGFTLEKAPAERKSAEPLQLRMAVSGDLQMSVNDDGSSTTFTREADNVFVSYNKLFVIDAKGRAVQARMLTEDGELVIEVEDAGAEYPLTIDPLLREMTKLTASDGAPGDVFGASVAISGNTLVVGAYLDTVGANPGQGSAYIFFVGCNTVPAASTNNVVRQKGSAATTATIATVFDSEDPLGYLAVTVASAPTGIVITGITNTNGVITASIAAACNAALGYNAVVVQIQDSDGGVTTATVLINVTPNTLPTLGSYNDTSVLAANATTVTPSLAPTDNGAIIEFSATSPTFAGILGAEPDSGVITIANARPAGTHIVTVTAIDDCGATISSGFILTVTCQTITINPSTIPAATAGSSYSQVFTQTSGMVPVTFSLSGALPTGLSFNAGTATLSGTPTQVGSFPITVTATDRNNCSGSRNYTFAINAPTLVWNGGTSSDWHAAANWTPNAVPTTYHDVLIPTSGVVNQPVIGSASSSINVMTLQAGRVLTIDSSRQLVTADNITCGGLIAGAGSLLFDGATFNQNGTVSLASVEFTAGVHALTGGGSFASGIITVLGGASVALTSNHSVSVIVINSGGSLDITNRTLTLTGAGTAIFNSGSVNATGSTVLYQGTVSQVVTANINYNNLIVNNPAGVSLAGDTMVNGLLDLQTDLTTGAFTLTMPESATSSGAGDVRGKVRRTGFVTGGAALSFGNPLNTIRIDTGTAPTDITVELVNLPPFGFSNTVSRTYTITANGGSGYTATMRLRYRDADASGLDETTFELWRQAGGNWQTPAGAAIRNTTQNWVEESGISEFSVWTISGGAGPICGVLTPNSQYFEAGGSEGSVIVTALANCSWAAGANVSWIEVTSSPSGSGTEVVSYVVRDNFTPMPRLGTITIAGQTFTVVQDGVNATECSFTIAPKFETYGAGGGAGSVSVSTEAQCAWEAVSDSSWIMITSICCGIGNGTITYSVAANPGPAGRNGTITIGGKVFAVKQKGQ